MHVNRFGCELYQKAFGGRAPPGPAGGAIALHQTSSRYYGEGRERKERVGKRKGGEGA